MSHANLTNIELEVLQELVWNVIDSIQSDGADRADNPTFVAVSNLYAKLGGTPPAPQEPELSETARQSATNLADDLIDAARNAGEEHE